MTTTSTTTETNPTLWDVVDAEGLRVWSFHTRAAALAEADFVNKNELGSAANRPYTVEVRWAS